MKTMNCRQLGGACDMEFKANSFDEIAEMSKQHGMKMVQEKDADHLKAMDDMKALMQSPDSFTEWFECKRNEFDALNHS